MTKYPEDPSSAGDGLTISHASTLLGVPVPTIRSWERRYGLPSTRRSPGGHRRYTHESLNQLRLMRDEIAIGRQAQDAARWVRGLLDEANPARERITALTAASYEQDATAIRDVLEQAHDELGLATTLDQVVLPSMRQIGSWWEQGRCDIGQEHFTTEVVRGWMARVTALAPPVDPESWVLLAVGPRDLHTLGLEALATLLVHQGTGCRVLGSRTPQRVLVTATVATPAAAVVVVCHLPTQRRSAVDSLRAVAPTGCPTFYAGNAFLFPASRRTVPGTYLGESIADAARTIGDAVARGRTEQRSQDGGSQPLRIASRAVRTAAESEARSKAP